MWPSHNGMNHNSYPQSNVGMPTEVTLNMLRIQEIEAKLREIDRAEELERQQQRNAAFSTFPSQHPQGNIPPPPPPSMVPPVNPIPVPRPVNMNGPGTMKPPQHHWNQQPSSQYGQQQYSQMPSQHQPPTHSEISQRISSNLFNQLNTNQFNQSNVFEEEPEIIVDPIPVWPGRSEDQISPSMSNEGKKKKKRNRKRNEPHEPREPVPPPSPPAQPKPVARYETVDEFGFRIAVAQKPTGIQQPPVNEFGFRTAAGPDIVQKIAADKALAMQTRLQEKEREQEAKLEERKNREAKDAERRRLAQIALETKERERLEAARLKAIEDERKRKIEEEERKKEEEHQKRIKEREEKEARRRAERQKEEQIREAEEARRKKEREREREKIREDIARQKREAEREERKRKAELEQKKLENGEQEIVIEADTESSGPVETFFRELSTMCHGKFIVKHSETENKYHKVSVNFSIMPRVFLSSSSSAMKSKKEALLQAVDLLMKRCNELEIVPKELKKMEFKALPVFLAAILKSHFLDLCKYAKGLEGDDKADEFEIYSIVQSSEFWKKERATLDAFIKIQQPPEERPAEPVKKSTIKIKTISSETEAKLATRQKPTTSMTSAQSSDVKTSAKPEVKKPVERKKVEAPVERKRIEAPTSSRYERSSGRQERDDPPRRRTSKERRRSRTPPRRHRSRSSSPRRSPPRRYRGGQREERIAEERFLMDVTEGARLSPTEFFARTGLEMPFRGEFHHAAEFRPDPTFVPPGGFRFPDSDEMMHRRSRSPIDERRRMDRSPPRFPVYDPRMEMEIMNLDMLHRQKMEELNIGGRMDMDMNLYQQQMKALDDLRNNVDIGDRHMDPRLIEQQLRGCGQMEMDPRVRGDSPGFMDHRMREERRPRSPRFVDHGFHHEPNHREPRAGDSMPDGPFAEERRRSPVRMDRIMEDERFVGRHPPMHQEGRPGAPKLMDLNLDGNLPPGSRPGPPSFHDVNLNGNLPPKKRKKGPRGLMDINLDAPYPPHLHQQNVPFRHQPQGRHPHW